MKRRVCRGLVVRDDALAWLRRQGHEVEQARLDAAMTAARQTHDYSSAVATPRRDMNPALAARLGITPSRSLTPGEIACLLNGQRADGQEIEGKKKQAATVSVRAIFGLARDRLPTRAEIAQVLAERKANGAPLPPDQAERAMTLQAHHDAIDSTMAEVERRLGRARQGQGGRAGWEPAARSSATMSSPMSCAISRASRSRKPPWV